MVRALLFVATLSMTVNLSAESSWMTVRLPSPQDANAYLVAGSKAAASGPSQIVGVATTLPLSASTTDITFSSHTENRRRFAGSIASPEGDLQGANGHRWVSVIFCVSISMSSEVSSLFANMLPL